MVDFFGQMTLEQYLAWFDDFARENFNGDKGLALLELELQGYFAEGDIK